MVALDTLLGGVTSSDSNQQSQTGKCNQRPKKGKCVPNNQTNKYVVYFCFTIGLFK
jgi:hypothetical protein